MAQIVVQAPDNCGDLRNEADLRETSQGSADEDAVDGGIEEREARGDAAGAGGEAIARVDLGKDRAERAREDERDAEPLEALRVFERALVFVGCHLAEEDVGAEENVADGGGAERGPPHPDARGVGDGLHGLVDVGDGDVEVVEDGLPVAAEEEREEEDVEDGDCGGEKRALLARALVGTEDEEGVEGGVEEEGEEEEVVVAA